jgi:hypothetical protein
VNKRPVSRFSSEKDHTRRCISLTKGMHEETGGIGTVKPFELGVENIFHQEIIFVNILNPFLTESIKNLALMLAWQTIQ